MRSRSPHPTHLSVRIARRFEKESGLKLARGPEHCALWRDSEAVAINHYGGMDYWQWSLGDYMSNTTVEVIEQDGRHREVQVGSPQAASQLAKMKCWAIERDKITGNCEIIGANRP